MSLLSVTVRKAEFVGVQAAQNNSYVTLKLQNVKTTTVTVKGANPCWEQDFLFETSDLNQGLLIEVWSKGMLWDRALGYCFIPLQTISYEMDDGSNENWVSLDADLVMQDSEVVATKTPTGNSILINCHFEPPFDAEGTEGIELQRKLERLNTVMEQDARRRLQYSGHSGYSEDSDYTSELNYPVGEHANSSASQFRGLASQMRTPGSSRENSWDDGATNTGTATTQYQKCFQQGYQVGYQGYDKNDPTYGSGYYDTPNRSLESSRENSYERDDGAFQQGYAEGRRRYLQAQQRLQQYGPEQTVPGEDYGYQGGPGEDLDLYYNSRPRGQKEPSRRRRKNWDDESSDWYRSSTTTTLYSKNNYENQYSQDYTQEYNEANTYSTNTSTMKHKFADGSNRFSKESYDETVPYGKQADPMYAKQNYPEDGTSYGDQQDYSSGPAAFRKQKYTTGFVKQKYQDTNVGFGKQDFTENNSGYGKQRFGEINAGYGKQNYQDTSGGFGKQDYTETSGSFGKQDYTEATGAFGKPDYTEATVGFGKQDYTEATGGFGKQDYTETNSGYGKQGYVDTNGIYQEGYQPENYQEQGYGVGAYSQQDYSQQDYVEQGYSQDYQQSTNGYKQDFQPSEAQCDQGFKQDSFDESAAKRRTDKSGRRPSLERQTTLYDDSVYNDPDPSYYDPTLVNQSGYDQNGTLSGYYDQNSIYSYSDKRSGREQEDRQWDSGGNQFTDNSNVNYPYDSYDASQDGVGQATGQAAAQAWDQQEFNSTDITQPSSTGYGSDYPNTTSLEVAEEEEVYYSPRQGMSYDEDYTMPSSTVPAGLATSGDSVEENGTGSGGGTGARRRQLMQQHPPLEDMEHSGYYYGQAGTAPATPAHHGTTEKPATLGTRSASVDRADSQDYYNTDYDQSYGDYDGYGYNENYNYAYESQDQLQGDQSSSAATGTASASWGGADSYYYSCQEDEYYGKEVDSTVQMKDSTMPPSSIAQSHQSMAEDSDAMTSYSDVTQARKRQFQQRRGGLDSLESKDDDLRESFETAISSVSHTFPTPSSTAPTEPSASGRVTPPSLVGPAVPARTHRPSIAVPVVSTPSSSSIPLPSVSITSPGHQLLRSQDSVESVEDEGMDYSERYGQSSLERGESIPEEEYEMSPPPSIKPSSPPLPSASLEDEMVSETHELTHESSLEKEVPSFDMDDVTKLDVPVPVMQQPAPTQTQPQRPKMNARERWHWAYNRVVHQINVSCRPAIRSLNPLRSAPRGTPQRAP